MAGYKPNLGIWSHEEQAQHRRQWRAALERGTFPQGGINLFDGSGYSPVGVACEISLHGDWLPLQRGDTTAYFYLGTASEMPEVVRDWLGLHSAVTYGYSAPYISQQRQWPNDHQKCARVLSELRGGSTVWH